MDENDTPELPPQPDRPSGTRIPTSRREPPVLEELAAGPATRPPEPPPPEQTVQPEGEFEWLAPFHNRLIIAGGSLLVLLALTAIVLFVFSRGDGGPGFANVSLLSDNGDTTPTPNVTLTAAALRTTTLRNGPGTTYSPLGTVPRGARVPVVGRNADDTWLQVTYPPGSPLTGWVDITFLDVTGDISQLEIAGPGAGPSIIVPTSPPTATVEEPTDTPEPTDRPSVTPEVTETPQQTGSPSPIETPEATEAKTPESTETPAVEPKPSPTEDTDDPGTGGLDNACYTDSTAAASRCNPAA